MDLTASQKLILDFIKDYTKTNNEPIKLKTIRERIKLSDKSLRTALLHLMINGYLREGVSRTTRTYVYIRGYNK